MIQLNVRQEGHQCTEAHLQENTDMTDHETKKDISLRLRNDVITMWLFDQLIYYTKFIN